MPTTTYFRSRTGSRYNHNNEPAIYSAKGRTDQREGTLFSAFKYRLETTGKDMRLIVITLPTGNDSDEVEVRMMR